VPVFDITVDGQTYHVEIPDLDATPLQVIVDGQSFEVEIVGSEIGAAPDQPAPSAWTLVPVAAPRPDQVRAAPLPAPATPVGGSKVIAPMPGTILSVEVRLGQPVEPGQVLCVLEAMKMKNPIRATQPGTVAEICVEAGKTVAHGELLVRLT